MRTNGNNEILSLSFYSLLRKMVLEKGELSSWSLQRSSSEMLLLPAYTKTQDNLQDDPNTMSSGWTCYLGEHDVKL